MGSDPCRTVGSFMTLSQESWGVSWSLQCGWPPADAGCSWPCIQPLPALMSQSPKRRPVSSLLDPGKGHSILFLEGSSETPEHIVAQVGGDAFSQHGLGTSCFHHRKPDQARSLGPWKVH